MLLRIAVIAAPTRSQPYPDALAQNGCVHCSTTTQRPSSVFLTRSFARGMCSGSMCCPIRALEIGLVKHQLVACCMNSGGDLGKVINMVVPYHIRRESRCIDARHPKVVTSPLDVRCSIPNRAESTPWLQPSQSNRSGCPKRMPISDFVCSQTACVIESESDTVSHLFRKAAMSLPLRSKSSIVLDAFRPSHGSPAPVCGSCPAMGKPLSRASPTRS